MYCGEGPVRDEGARIVQQISTERCAESSTVFCR